MNIKKHTIILLALAAITLPSLIIFPTAVVAATQKSQPIPGDRRLRYFNFQPNTVYEYTGFLRYASRIDLDPDESIQSITMGDQTGWQINPVGNRLFLKPVEVGAETHMTIITDKRIYYFEMYSREAEDINDPDLAFATSFNYTDSGTNGSIESGFMNISYQDENTSYVPDLEKNEGYLNMNYTMSGAKTVAPLQVFDDGEFTYFKFKDINAEYPAIFQVLPDGNEAIINFRVSREEYVVVEMVTSQFTLRYGNKVVCVFNEKMPLETEGLEKEDENTSFFGIF